MPESVIVDVTINQEKAIKESAELERQLIANKKAINDLTTATANNTGAQKASAEKLVKLREEQKALRAEQSAVSKEIQATNRVLATNANSIEGMEARVKQLTQEWKKADFGSDKFKQLQIDLRKANADLAEQKIAVGNTSGLFSQFVRGLSDSKTAFGGAITGAQGFNTALKANPVGAVLGVLLQFIEALQSNAQVADFVTRVMAGLNKVFQTLTDAVVDLAQPIIDVFENPMDSLKAFGQLLTDQVNNRVEGLIELIPALGKAISLVFKGEFGEAAKTVVDAQGKIVFGVENVTEKVAAGVTAVSEFGSALLTAGDEGFNAAKKLDEFTVSQQNLNNEIAKNDQLVRSLTFQLTDKSKSEQERIAIATQIAELETSSAEKQVQIAKELLAAEQLKLKGKQLTAEEEARLSKLVTDVQIAESEKQIAQSQKQTRINILLDKEEAAAAVDSKKSQQQLEQEAKQAEQERERQHKERLTNRLNESQLYFEQQKNIEKQNLLDGLINEEEYQARLNEIRIAALQDQLDILTTSGEQTAAKQLEIQTAQLDQQIAFNEQQRQKEQENADNLKAINQQKVEDAAKTEQARFTVAQAAQKGLTSLLNVFGAQGAAAAAFSKVLATFQIGIDTAKSISAGIAGATTSATATGPGAFVATPVFIATTIATILGAFGQATALLKSSPTPKAQKFNWGGRLLRYFSGGNLAFEGGHIPAQGGMITGRSHAENGVKFNMGNGVTGEADGRKGEAYIINTRHDPFIKATASALNVMGGGRAFDHGGVAHFADGGISSTVSQPVFQSIDMGNQVIEAMQGFTVIATIEDINAGLNRVATIQERANS